VGGAGAGDRLGTAVGGGADVNDDGVADAVAGAPHRTAPGCPADSGEAYVMSPAPPDAVASVTVERDAGGTRLEWDPPNRAIDYNVYSLPLDAPGADGAVRTSDGKHLACSVQDDTDNDGRPDAVVFGDPNDGEGFLFLVTAANLFGESSLGPAHGAPTRLNDAPCP
jgi:hypothetical protein